LDAIQGRALTRGSDSPVGYRPGDCPRRFWRAVGPFYSGAEVGGDRVRRLGAVPADRPVAARRVAVAAAKGNRGAGGGPALRSSHAGAGSGAGRGAVARVWSAARPVSRRQLCGSTMSGAVDLF